MTARAVFDFSEQQARARRQTAVLVLLFLLITLTISLLTGVVAGFLFGGAAEHVGHQPGRQAAVVPGGLEDMLEQIDWHLALAVAVLVAGIILATAGIRALMLGGNGATVARAMGGIEVTRDTRNPAKRRLYNVVEEMSIAATLPMPRVFVIKHEKGINAFAAGLRPGTAAIGITHGALASLTRDELQGVVAHEFAHINNGDMRLNLRLMAMIFGLVALSVAGRMVMRSVFITGRGRRDQRAVLVAMAVGLTLVVLGALGVFAGRLLQAAISRQREHLADATAVQFTRQPGPLANALKKIGALQRDEQLQNPHGEEIRHMLFAEAVARRTPGLLATHPPLIDRIRALDPGFNPKTDPVWQQPQREMIRESRRGLRKQSEGSSGLDIADA